MTKYTSYVERWSDAQILDSIDERKQLYYVPRLGQLELTSHFLGDAILAYRNSKRSSVITQQQRPTNNSVGNTHPTPEQSHS